GQTTDDRKQIYRQIHRTMTANALERTDGGAHSSAIYLLSSVLCPLSSVLCPLSSVLCPLSSVLCPLSSVLCPLSSVLCPLSSVLCRPTFCRLSSDIKRPRRPKRTGGLPRTSGGIVVRWHGASFQRLAAPGVPALLHLSKQPSP